MPYRFWGLLDSCLATGAPLPERLWRSGLQQHAYDAPIAGSAGNRPIIKVDLRLKACVNGIDDQSYRVLLLSSGHLIYQSASTMINYT